MFPGLEPEGKRKKGVAPAEVPEEVRQLDEDLPAEIRLGGSTWSFPGWMGLVWDGKYSESKLANEGLAAYAQHPLLRGVGLDRTYYQPVEAGELADYADAAPEGFRFLVKAQEVLTVSRWPDRPRYGEHKGKVNPLFLDHAYATDNVVAPFVEGLGKKGGALLFQFSPQDLGVVEKFADELHDFLSALPRGPVYAIELRNREALTKAYADMLAATGAVHCHNVHPRMPDVRTQARLTGGNRPDAPATILRWLLGRGLTYEEAGRRYAPFDRMQAPDPEARKAIAELAREAHAAGRPFLGTINNNAEGCAPMSVVELVREIVGRLSSGPE